MNAINNVHSTDNTKSGNIICDNENIIIHGIHYKICDWYTYKNVNDIKISREKVLHIEYIKMYSKRTLMMFILSMGLFFILMGNNLQNLFDGSIISFCAITLLIAGGISIISYAITPIYMLKISAIGAMVGVNTKYYDKLQLDSIIYRVQNNI